MKRSLQVVNAFLFLLPEYKIYQMLERLEIKGYWWLPSNPDGKVAGILTYIPYETIILELIGNFDSEKAPIDVLIETKTENIIHGNSSDSKKITLVNCYPSGSVNFSCPFPIIRYRCNFIVIGKLLEDFKQNCFFKSFVTIPELTHWSPPTSLKTTHKFDKEKRMESTSISFNRVSKIISSDQIDDNTHLIIKPGVNYQGDHFSPTIQQKTYLEILKESDSSIEDFCSYINLYEQFLSLATLQTVSCSKIELYDKTIYQEYNDGKKLHHPIEIVYVQYGPDNELTKIKSHNFLFDYNSIASEYAKIIKKWYGEKEDIAPIRAHLIDSIKNRKKFSSVNFLIVIQALEGFWWRFRDDDYRVKNKIDKNKKTQLETILKELINEFSSVDKIRSLDLYIQSVVDSRHYYSHFMNKTSKPHTLDGIELFDLTFKLRKILICCLLNFIGFDYSQINQIFNHSNNSLLRESTFGWA